MAIVVPADTVLGPQTHRFFDEVGTALAAYATATAGYVTHAQNSGYKFLEDWPMRMACLTRREQRSTLEIEVRPASILTPLTQFGWPTSLDLKFGLVTDVTEPPPPLPVYKPDLKGMERLAANIFEHAFLTYYESVVALIKAHSGDVVNWHATLQFARTVRNAFAHGGTLNITDQRPTGTWGGLTYSSANNHRRLMFNDLSSGDLLLLMLEMALPCPQLKLRGDSGTKATRSTWCRPGDASTGP